MGPVDKKYQGDIKQKEINMVQGQYIRTKNTRKNIGKALKQSYNSGKRKLSNSCWKKGHIPWNKGLSSKQKNSYNSLKRVCKNCKTEYIPTSSRQTYCCDCFYIEIKCNRCGKSMIKKRTNVDYRLKQNPLHIFYCSQNCKHDNIRNIKCKQCNKTFETNIIYGRKFCCRKCYDEWQYNQETRECLWCGKPFLTWNNGTQQYCCKRCALSSTGETNIEKLFRQELEKNNIKFRQYEKIGTYYVDFIINDNIIVECDGEYWHSKPEVKERDNRKNQYLNKNNYKLYRFSDKEILNNVEKCLGAINELHN
jgi:very-short-patch-repair endonuclease